MLKKKHTTKHVSVAKNTNSLFNSPKSENKAQHCTQNVNVTVTIEQPQDDCLAGCFKAFANMFKKK